MYKAIQVRAEKAIQEKVFPGCVIGVVKKNGDREIFPFGNFTYESDASKVSEDSVYDMASVTKSIPVASLVLTFAMEGKLHFSDTVKTYVPSLQNDYGATIEDLLTYRVQGPRLSRLTYRTFEEIRTHILEHGFNSPPGEREYTNLPAFILGLALERIGESHLAALAHRYFFEPLNMVDTTFFPHDIERIPPTEVINGTEIRGIVQDESARVFARARRAVGHAGLFSTAPDILNFLESLLQGTYAHIVDGAQKRLGWQKAESWFAGAHFGSAAFGKTGFTGTSVLCDVQKGVALVILSNRTYPIRPSDATSIHSAVNTFRADIADIVLR